MGTLFIILGTLFIALMVVIPLVERFGKGYSPEEVRKISRFVLPLIGLLLVGQLLAYIFMK